ncbi:hypothetical protein HF521_006436, partial [Silurus meridionalis]
MQRGRWCATASQSAKSATRRCLLKAETPPTCSNTSKTLTGASTAKSVCTRHSEITRFDPLRTENEQESVELHLPTTDALSPVWKYFGYPKNADGSLVSDGFPLCRLCRLKVVAKGGSTTNMLVHLRAYHLEVYEEVKEAITTLRTAWGIEPPELHPPTQNVTSAVWQYFGYLKDAGGSVVCDDFPICKLCQQKVASKRRCTTNMFKHLKDYHRSVYDEVR